MSQRYPTPEFRRMALAPAILCAIVLLTGIALIAAEGYVVIRFAVSILALIVAVFAWQARQWWWLPPLLAIAVVWNPVIVVPLGGDLWLGLHYAAALVLIVVGLMVKVRNIDDRNPRSPKPPAR